MRIFLQQIALLLIMTISNITIIAGQVTVEEKYRAIETALLPYQQIKATGLVFRVNDYHNAITKLEEQGNYTRADQLKSDAELQKKAFIEEVSQNYTFSKYYFMDSKDIDRAIDGDYTNLIYDVEGNFITWQQDDPIYEAFLTSDISKPSRQTKFFYVYKIIDQNRMLLDQGFPQGFKYTFPYFLRYFRLNTYGEKAAHLNDQIQKKYEKLISDLTVYRTRIE